MCCELVMNSVTGSSETIAARIDSCSMYLRVFAWFESPGVGHSGKVWPWPRLLSITEADCLDTYSRLDCLFSFKWDVAVFFSSSIILYWKESLEDFWKQTLYLYLISSQGKG